MRIIYTLLFYLITPLILFRLYWRGFKAPDYRKRWKQRLAIYEHSYPQGVIWIHAVSVGEAEAVFPLVKRLQQQYPDANFLVTTTTPTGSARVRAVLADSVHHVYLPYDLPVVVNRFLSVFKPVIAVFMEKEIWPNLYARCAEQNIPVMIINARLSANSAKGYKKIPALIKPALANLTWISTQTEEDKIRFIEIGTLENRISVAGNLKFDLELGDNIIQQAQEIRLSLFSGRYVWLIASTHEGEELLFTELYRDLKQQIPELLLVIVPRHPERFQTVKNLSESMTLNTVMRSSNQPCAAETDVYIADTMGELKLLYACADICFVGGSMVPVGGHNVLEPAALNIPILFGPHMFNFKEIAENLLRLDAAIQCMDADMISDVVINLYNDRDRRVQMAARAKQFVSDNQGATQRVAELIADKMS